MPRWTFYDSKTGEIHPRRFSCSQRDHAERNAPAGHSVIEGDYIREKWRVDPATGQPVPQTPVPPDDDHEWSEGLTRFILKPDVVATRAARSAALAQIRELEARQARAVRESLLGDASAIDRLAEIDRQIVALRDSL